MFTMQLLVSLEQSETAKQLPYFCRLYTFTQKRSFNDTPYYFDYNSRTKKIT